MKNLIITGGWAHDFSSTSSTLREVLSTVNSISGVEQVVVHDINEAADALTKQNFDVVTVYACWFTMTDERYTPEQRASWARTTPPAFIEKMTEHHQRGGGLLVLHTGIICFTDWPEWSQWVGGEWVWGQSWHPALEDLVVTRSLEQGSFDQSNVGVHPIVHDIETIAVHDERYSDMGIDPASVILYESAGANGLQPAAWAHTYGGSRVIFSSLGHDARSLTNAAHQTLLRRSLAWVAGYPDETVCVVN